MGKSPSLSKNERLKGFCYRISMSSLEELLMSQLNHDFPKKACDEKPEHSVVDRMFLKTAADSVIKQNGHYQLHVAFRLIHALVQTDG